MNHCRGDAFPSQSFLFITGEVKQSKLVVGLEKPSILQFGRFRELCRELPQPCDVVGAAERPCKGEQLVARPGLSH